MHRIFIAINLPEDIKRELCDIQNKFDWEGSEWAKWTKQENLHITLEFFGNISDNELETIFKKAEDFAKGNKPFIIKLDKISFFPNSSLPQYIFATGKYENSSRTLIHVTLARIKQWQWKRINPEERPEIRQDTNLNFEVNSIEVMESFLKRTGPEYKVLKSFSLEI